MFVYNNVKNGSLIRQDKKQAGEKGEPHILHDLDAKEAANTNKVIQLTNAGCTSEQIAQEPYQRTDLKQFKKGSQYQNDNDTCFTGVSVANFA